MLNNQASDSHNKITFVTGNKNKLREARAILKDYQIDNLELDLPEIQEIDAKKVIEAKLAEAYSLNQDSYIVEDTSLYIDSLNGLPGPLIKWFIQSLGTAGIVELTHKYKDHTAYASCMIGHIENTGTTNFFEGRVKGKIVSPKGDQAFGWDPIFLPDNKDKTFGEMSAQEKNAISHRKLAFTKLADFLQTQNDSQKTLAKEQSSI